MTLKSKPYYWVDCDRCGQTCDYGDYSAMYDESQAVEGARDNEWLVTDDGHHYCDDCTTYDEETDERINLPPIDHANGAQ